MPLEPEVMLTRMKLQITIASLIFYCGASLSSAKLNSRRSFGANLITGGGAAAVGFFTKPRQAFAADAEVKVTDSGLKIIDLVEGDGVQPLQGQTVKVDYTGWLNDFDSNAVFDTSKKFGRGPLKFAVGTGRVIPGWDEALLSMKVGGKRRIVIPSNLGYGKRGAGGVIPPDATLFFEMELLGISQ